MLCGVLIGILIDDGIVTCNVSILSAVSSLPDKYIKESKFLVINKVSY